MTKIETALKKATNLTTEEFAEKAISGGWIIPDWFEEFYFETEDIIDTKTADEILNRWMLLTPNAWKACGKSEGKNWCPKYSSCQLSGSERPNYKDQWEIETVAILNK